MKDMPQVLRFLPFACINKERDTMTETEARAKGVIP